MDEEDNRVDEILVYRCPNCKSKVRVIALDVVLVRCQDCNEDMALVNKIISGGENSP